MKRLGFSIVLWLLAAAQSALGQPGLATLQREVVSTWLVTVEGESRTRTLNIKGVKRAQDDRLLLDATYGWSTGPHHPIEIVLTLRPAGYRLTLTTPASTLIIADGGSDGVLRGTFTRKSGRASGVRIDRISAEPEPEPRERPIAEQQQTEQALLTERKRRRELEAEQKRIDEQLIKERQLRESLEQKWEAQLAKERELREELERQQKMQDAQLAREREFRERLLLEQRQREEELAREAQRGSDRRSRTTSKRTDAPFHGSREGKDAPQTSSVPAIDAFGSSTAASENRARTEEPQKKPR